MARVSSILQSHGIVDTRSKSTFFPLRTPFLFDNMLGCPPFGSLCLFVLSHAFFLVVSFHVCWFCVSFVIVCAQLEQGYLEEGCNSLSACKKGKDASKKMQVPKRAKFSRLGCLASPSGPLSLSLSLSFH